MRFLLAIMLAAVILVSILLIPNTGHPSPAACPTIPDNTPGCGPNTPTPFFHPSTYHSPTVEEEPVHESVHVFGGFHGE